RKYPGSRSNFKSQTGHTAYMSSQRRMLNGRNIGPWRHRGQTWRTMPRMAEMRRVLVIAHWPGLANPLVVATGFFAIPAVAHRAPAPASVPAEVQKQPPASRSGTLAHGAQMGRCQ